MANTHLPPQWRQRLMALVNAHGWETAAFSFQVLRLLAAWAQAEGGSAEWNPLNTTLRLFGSTDYNTAGVQNYLRPVDGIAATGMTLANGHYPGILGDMQNGTKTAEQIANDRRPEFETWGTNPDVILRVLAAL